MKNKKGKILWYWLADHKYVLLYFVLYSMLLFVVYGLYRLPFSIAGYTFVLAGCVGLVFAVVDFIRYAAHYNELEKLAGRFPMAKLPEPKKYHEKKYHTIIDAQEEERIRLSALVEQRQKENEEYYTLWVHQAKTPISAMRLLLQQEEEDPRLHSKLGQELFRIEQYTDMALQYQRLSSLNNDLVFKEHSLKKLVTTALKNSAPLFIGKGMAVELGEIEGVFVCDEKWFCFVLEQIFSNAVKYTPKGSVHIYSEANTAESKKAEAGVRTTLVIQDEGIGISPEDLPRIFEKGYTGTTGRKNARATGIGLYLCREIAGRLGFEIEVTSIMGKGTTVKLHLNKVELELE